MDNAQEAFGFYQSQGLNKAAAAGLVGNQFVESEGFSPDVIDDKNRGDGGIAHGITQWHPDRWGPLLQKINKSHPSFADQLVMTVIELKQRNQWNALNTINDPAVAAVYVDQNFEVSSGDTRGARQRYASELFSTGDISGSSSDTGSNSPGGWDSIKIIGGAGKNAVTDKLATPFKFVSGKLFEAGIGVLGVLAIIGGLVFIVLSTRAGKTAATAALL